ncbi:MAG: ATPase, T2SS/T4P/T4SS family [Candidatus Aenigmatarchaeota archaeon]
MPAELAQYKIVADKVPATITIARKPEAYTPIYSVSFPSITPATEAILTSIREKMVETIKLKITEILDPRAADDIRARFFETALFYVSNEMPDLADAERDALAGYLLHEMLGLGKIEILLHDDNLEEVVINNSVDPLWVYHKKFGWLRTNVFLQNEAQISNYSAIIGRKVGRQITTLNPLMDAQLPTGDRVNATLFPISSNGNTITIRKFRREPWTIVNFIGPTEKTTSMDIGALLWLCVQYELNVLIAGGTASGKTSMLNALMPFIPPNQRVISIEDTRELRLPEYLHWIPLVTREPSIENKGEVTMLHLLINSLRMRPDRVVLGEVRRQYEAEVLFEAMNTGHSVYSTIHADRAEQVLGRLTNPPISLPESMLESLHVVLVQFRHRRLGIRRTYQLAEVIPYEQNGQTRVKMDVLYKWKPQTDIVEKIKKSTRITNEIQMHTGMTEKEMAKDLKEKESILKWAVANRLDSVGAVGKMVAEYYNDSSNVMKIINGKKNPELLLGQKIMHELRQG